MISGLTAKTISLVKKMFVCERKFTRLIKNFFSLLSLANSSKQYAFISGQNVAGKLSLMRE